MQFLLPKNDAIINFQNRSCLIFFFLPTLMFKKSGKPGLYWDPNETLEKPENWDPSGILQKSEIDYNNVSFETYKVNVNDM